MDLMPYVDNLRRELAVAAEAGGPEARALADRLTGALESAAKLTLLEALSAAADEITRDLAPGSVDVRLRGGDPAFVVTPPQPGPSSGGAAAWRGGDRGGGRAARRAASFRGGRHRADDPAAARAPQAACGGGRHGEGLSVNAWLVRAISAAFEPGAGPRPADRPQQHQSGRSFTGWVR